MWAVHIQGTCLGATNAPGGLNKPTYPLTIHMAIPVTSTTWQLYLYYMAALPLLHGSSTSTTWQLYLYYMVALPLLHGSSISYLMATSWKHVLSMAFIHNYKYGETCSCDHLYSETTSIQRPLGHVLIVVLPCISTSI